MKFIHIADVHWGARPEREQTFGMIREQEIKETFQRVIDHANKQQVDLLLIAGDLFDQPPTQQELREVDYLLSRLNHTQVITIIWNRMMYFPSINGIRKFIFWMENNEIIFLLKILKRPFMALVIGRIRSRNHCMIA